MYVLVQKFKKTFQTGGIQDSILSAGEGYPLPHSTPKDGEGYFLPHYPQCWREVLPPTFYPLCGL